VVINSTAKSPTVVLRILDGNGDDVTGVSLGDELFLKVEMEPNSAYGVVARELIAKSGANDEELMLLDSRGKDNVFTNLCLIMKNISFPSYLQFHLF